MTLAGSSGEAWLYWTDTAHLWYRPKPVLETVTKKPEEILETWRALGVTVIVVAAARLELPPSWKAVWPSVVPVSAPTPEDAAYPAWAYIFHDWFNPGCEPTRHRADPEQVYEAGLLTNVWQAIRIGERST